MLLLEVIEVVGQSDAAGVACMGVLLHGRANLL